MVIRPRLMRLLGIVMVCSLLLPSLPAAAQDDLAAGDAATIAPGVTASLMDSPSSNGFPVASLPEGSAIQVADGPLVAPEDGSIWFAVTTADGAGGYLPSWALTAAGLSAATTPEPWARGILVSDSSAPIPCYTAADRTSPILTVVYATQEIALTAQDANGWAPVRCDEFDGFIERSAIRLPGDPAPTVAPSATASVSVTRPPASTPTAAMTQAPASQTSSPTAAKTQAPASQTAIASLTPGPKGGSASATSPASTTPVASPSAPATEAVVRIAELSVGVLSLGATVRVANTNGSGLRCRTTAGFDGAILTVVPAGSELPVRGAQVGDWVPVTCAGKDGWVNVAYLEVVSAASSPSPTTPSASATASPTPATVTVGTVSGTNGTGVRCRSAASSTAAIIVVLPEGTVVQLRGATSAGWQPVTCGGKDGWISASYLTLSTVTVTPTAAPSRTASPSPTPSPTSTPLTGPLQPGENAVVSGTEGLGIRLRSAPSTTASIIAVLPEGEGVRVRAGSVDVWVAVTWNGRDGFVHRDWLVRGTGTNSGGVGGNTTTTPTGTPGTPTPTPGAGTPTVTPIPGQVFVSGDRVRTTDSLRLRKTPDLNAEVIIVIDPGVVLQVTGPKVGLYYPVLYDDLAGYVHGDYLVRTTDPVTDRTPVMSGDAGSAPATAMGLALVAFAMKYIGYPYVWATHGPNSFDCSGFTWFVLNSVAGVNPYWGTWTQWAAGTPVQWGDLRPGDIVFFQNTYTFGLSHVGMYIGNNQFIHAENETTGVRISSLTSPYYAQRWYGARRIAAS